MLFISSVHVKQVLYQIMFRKDLLFIVERIPFFLVGGVTGVSPVREGDGRPGLGGLWEMPAWRRA